LLVDTMFLCHCITGPCDRRCTEGARRRRQRRSACGIVSTARNLK